MNSSPVAHLNVVQLCSHISDNSSKAVLVYKSGMFTHFLSTWCSFQVCFATETTPASVTRAEKALSATPTPSVACSTATVLQDTWATPATATETNAALVRKRNSNHTYPICLPACSHLTMSPSSSLPGTNPCEHGGQCVNTDGSFTCNCVRGYAGPRCEQDVNECASNPCQNDGTCLDRIGDYCCICMPGMFLEKW